MYKVYEDMRCPLCGGKIQETDKAFGCTNWRDEDGGCRFAIWKNYRGYCFSEQEVRALLSGRTIGPLMFKRKDGGTYHSRIRWDQDRAGLVLVREKKNADSMREPGKSQSGQSGQRMEENNPPQYPADDGFAEVDDEDLPFC